MSSKRKSRSIISLPSTNNNELHNRFKNSFDSCLVEDIHDKPGTSVNSFSTNSSDLQDILGLGIKISGLSSSSSLSWSEEYESEVGKKVQLELEKLDRIFQGFEQDVSSYDMDEITEWKQCFPHLYILGHNTPTNSAGNSDVNSGDEDISIKSHQNGKSVIMPRNRSSFMGKRRSELDAEISSSTRVCNLLPRKPKSLEIDQYLKISSIKTPDTPKRKWHLQESFKKQKSIGIPGDLTPEYTSLPFLTTTPIKTQNRRRVERNKPPRMLILPPIDANFRSISATPRQASSKSMYVPLNYERSSSKKQSQAAKLKSDLMKLFDSIPISNR